MTILDLWLPILLATLAVHFGSFIAWAVSPHHNADYTPLPDDGVNVSGQIRANNLKPAMYLFPYPFGGRAKDPAVAQRLKDGPLGLVTVIGPVNFARNMALTLLTFFVISVFIGYLGLLARPAGSSFLDVFQVCGAAGVLGYSFAHFPYGVWWGNTMRSMLLRMIDGIIFGLISGAIFAALWPSQSPAI